MIEDDAEHLVVGPTHIPWMYIDLHPLCHPRRSLRFVALPTQGGARCADRSARSPIRAQGRELERYTGDRCRALARKPHRPVFQDKAGAATEAPPAAAEPAPAKATGPPAGRKKSRGQTTGDTPSKRRRPVATSPGATPGRRERRVRLKPALAAAVTHHLASVAAGLPSGVLGAAFAVELLRALEAAILGDQPTWTGKTIDLFARLHKKGLLSSIPADQAGRAALKLLADRTPLVRRLHYRRWCFAFGDIHEPASPLRVRLGVISAE